MSTCPGARVPTPRSARVTRDVAVYGGGAARGDEPGVQKPQERWAGARGLVLARRNGRAIESGERVET